MVQYICGAAKQGLNRTLQVWGSRDSLADVTYAVKSVQYHTKYRYCEGGFLHIDHDVIAYTHDSQIPSVV